MGRKEWEFGGRKVLSRNLAGRCVNMVVRGMGAEFPLFECPTKEDTIVG